MPTRLSSFLLSLGLVFASVSESAEQVVKVSSRNGSPSEGGSGRSAGARDRNSESLENAVARVNEKLADECSVLRPTKLTVKRLRWAIAKSIQEFSQSEAADREHYISTLTAMLRTNSTPPLSPLGYSLSQHTNKGYREKYAPDEYVNTVSLNYCFSVRDRAGTGIRIVGLPELAEGFDVVRKRLRVTEMAEADRAKQDASRE